jgi:hypothetical protein
MHNRPTPGTRSMQDFRRVREIEPHANRSEAASAPLRGEADGYVNGIMSAVEVQLAPAMLVPESRARHGVTRRSLAILIGRQSHLLGWKTALLPVLCP